MEKTLRTELTRPPGTGVREEGDRHKGWRKEKEDVKVMKLRGWGVGREGLGSSVQGRHWAVP